MLNFKFISSRDVSLFKLGGRGVQREGREFKALQARDPGYSLTPCRVSLALPAVTPEHC